MTLAVVQHDVAMRRIEELDARLKEQVDSLAIYAIYKCIVGNGKPVPYDPYFVALVITFSFKVMAISVISVSSDSSEDSVGTLAGRVILFGTIPTTIPDTTPSVIPPTTYSDLTLTPTVSPTIPSSPDYTPASPNYSPASDMEFDPSEDPSSDHIPPLPATSDSDIPDTPPSPTHGTPFTETTLST
ncbi:hypothetical protein Tco_0711939 [Tanacetum coccineum]